MIAMSTGEIEQQLELLEIEIMYLRRHLNVSGQSPIEIHATLRQSQKSIERIVNKFNTEIDDWETISEINQ